MRGRGFYGWGKKAERLLVYMVVLCAVLLVVTQSFVAGDPMRKMIGYVDLDNINLGDVAIAPHAAQNVMAGEPVMTLLLKEYSSLPKMYLLVNGEPAGGFDDRYLTFQVQDGDLLELDASFYNHQVEVEVVTASENIIFPKKKEIVVINGIHTLGKVKIDDSQ